MWSVPGFSCTVAWRWVVNTHTRWGGLLWTAPTVLANTALASLEGDSCSQGTPAKSSLPIAGRSQLLVHGPTFPASKHYHTCPLWLYSWFQLLKVQVDFLSYSTRASTCWGSHAGLWDKTYGAPLLLPLHHLAVKLNAMSFVLCQCSLGLSISSRQGLFLVLVWAVVICDMSKFCRSIINILHLFAVHATASISSSIMAKRDLALLKKRDPACTRTHLSVGDCCCKMNPTPCLLASVLAKKASVGLVSRCCFAVAILGHDWQSKWTHSLCSTEGAIAPTQVLSCLGL